MSLSKELFEEEFRANTKLGVDESLLWWKRFGSGTKVEWLAQVCHVLPPDAWVDDKYKSLWDRPEWDKVCVSDILQPLCELDGDIVEFLIRFGERIRGCDDVINTSLKPSAVFNAWLMKCYEFAGEFPMPLVDLTKPYASQIPSIEKPCSHKLMNAWIAHAHFFGCPIEILVSKIPFKGPLDPALLMLSDSPNLKECALWLAWSTGYSPPNQTLNAVLKRCGASRAQLSHSLNPHKAPWSKYLKRLTNFVSATYEWQTDATPDVDWKSVMLVDDVEDDDKAKAGEEESEFDKGKGTDEFDNGLMPHICTLDV